MALPRFNWMTRAVVALRAIGPYAAIELLLPGGTLIALSLWAFRHRSSIAARARRARARLRVLTTQRRGSSSVLPGAMADKL
jgi:hypothetical protein